MTTTMKRKKQKQKTSTLEGSNLRADRAIFAAAGGREMQLGWLMVLYERARALSK